MSLTRTFVFSFLFSFTLYAQGVELASSNLPIFIIDTQGQSIPSDNPRIVADLRVIFNENGNRNNLTDTEDHYLGKISIETRGESSGGWDIKSYAFETQNEDGTNRNVSLLGLPEENDWILHAPFYDRSLIRNVLSYRLSREMGWYASRTVYCEVVLNGEYQGIYALMEKIKQDKNRVDIATLTPDEISGDDVTGGYILRVDKENWNPGIDSQYPPTENSNVTLRYQYYEPKGDELVGEQEAYIQEFMYAFEDLMHDGNYSDPISGYAQYLNVGSFVDYIILNELSRNVDGYRLSSYLTKQKNSNGGKLIAGPVWDYNFSFGNAGYYEAERIEGWQLLYFIENESFHRNDGFQVPFWWKVLFNDGKFRQQLRERWVQLRESTLSINSLNTTIDQFAENLSEAQVRNFQVRPEPGATELGGGWHPFDPRHDQINSYEDELTLTKTWIADRIEWIDTNILLLTSNESEASRETPDSYSLDQNYPNPFNPSTNIQFSLPSSSFVQLEVFNIQGQLVQTLVSKTMSSGNHQVEFNAENTSSGMYFYTLTTGKMSITKKMLLVK